MSEHDFESDVRAMLKGRASEMKPEFSDGDELARRASRRRAVKAGFSGLAVVVVAAVGIGAVTRVPSGHKPVETAATTTVPAVSCPTVGSDGGPSAPGPVATPREVRGDAAFNLASYQARPPQGSDNAQADVLAPRGWECRAQVQADNTVLIEVAPHVLADPRRSAGGPSVTVIISHFAAPRDAATPPTTAYPTDSLCDGFGHIPQVQGQAESDYICGNESGVTVVNGVYEYTTSTQGGEILSAAMMQPPPTAAQPFDWFQTYGVPHDTAIAMRDDYIARNAHGGPAPPPDTSPTTEPN